jgi:hypothetical protein
MARPFRDVPEPAVKNARISVSLRRALRPGALDPVPLPRASRFVYSATGELPC